MRPGGVPAWAALRSFLAANALYETLAMYAPRDLLALKWPNDVLLDGRKVAGILLESAGNSTRVDWLAIGIGVNLIRAPKAEPDAAFAPIALRDVTGESVDATDFLSILAGHYATEELVLERLGFDAIRQDWLARAAKLGEEITARTGNRSVTGIFDTVDEDGQLVLITGTGPVRIPAADIYF
jgi:BirA family biotin operon repressor/biotin-[acetyl-CoA-carboxylase] ligase